ncbi:MAG: hypothetical protein ACYC35_08085 [Pirellulales bacterium]
MRKLLHFGFGLAVLVSMSCFGASKASGALINGVVLNGLNHFSDIDYERLVNSGASNTTIDVGDTLEAIIHFTQANTTNIDNSHNPLGSFYELTAHAKITVASVVPLGSTGLANFTFTNGFADGSAIKLYEEASTTDGTYFRGDVAPDAVGTEIGGIARASNGVLISTFGLAAGSDDFWVANGAPMDINAFDPLSSNIAGGLYFFGLTMQTNPGGLWLVDDGVTTSTGPTSSLTVHDLTGNGELLKPVGASALWDVQTKTSVFFAGVPEPGSFVVWGLMLGCVAAVQVIRRRKS